MEIVTTSTSEQTFKVIPRELTTDVRFILVDKEQESNNLDVTIVCSIFNEFLIVPFTIPFFKEGRKYFIKILNLNNERIWMGEAFCTNDTDLQNYKING
jgi:hypothetical protein